MDAIKNAEEGMPIPLPPGYSQNAMTNLPQLISPPLNPHYSIKIEDGHIQQEFVRPISRNARQTAEGNRLRPLKIGCSSSAVFIGLPLLILVLLASPFLLALLFDLNIVG